MRSTRPRVLVLDGMWNKSLAAVRSFGEKGFYVAAGEATRFSAALFSRYADRRIVYPSPASRPGEFMDWLMGELEEGGYGMVLPSELSTQQLLSRHREEISRHTGFPFPDHVMAERAHDKAWLMRFAGERGYPIPETCFPKDADEAEAFAGALGYPVVIKPVASSGSRGVAYVSKKDDFRDAYLKVHSRYPLPIVQEYIPSGPHGGYGVGALFNNDHEPRAAFVYRRLREYPVTGGPSTLRESVRDDRLKDLALSILKDLKWTGAAMVEFRMDARDGNPRLLEINPRLWGSLRLAILSGVDFPYLMYRMATEGDVEPVTGYRAGVRCRWLIPGDIMHLFTSRRKLKALRDMLVPADGDDILSIKDPMPVIGRISSFLPFLYDREMRRLIFR